MCCVLTVLGRLRVDVELPRAGHLAEVLTAESAQGLRIHLFTRARIAEELRSRGLVRPGGGGGPGCGTRRTSVAGARADTRGRGKRRRASQLRSRRDPPRDARQRCRRAGPRVLDKSTPALDRGTKPTTQMWEAPARKGRSSTSCPSCPFSSSCPSPSPGTPSASSRSTSAAAAAAAAPRPRRSSRRRCRRRRPRRRS